jgi:hypothetical protein
MHGTSSCSSYLYTSLVIKVSTYIAYSGLLPLLLISTVIAQTSKILFNLNIYVNIVKKLRHRTSGVTLGTSDNGIDKRTNSTGRSKREEEMYQARLRQQEILNQKAKEALEQKRELLKTKPKNDDPSSEPNSTHDNETSQTSSTKKPSSLATTKSKLKAARTTEYNPMNPWSASAGGGTYRYDTKMQ